jgi:ketosteroid isomerase-like protein
MNRRDFVTGAGAVLGAAAAGAVSTAAESDAVKQAITDNYALYSGTDFEKYRATLAPDYVLLEHGELMNVDDDEKSMKARPPGFRRTDAFDFRSVTIEGSLAYAVYFLTSDIADDTRRMQRRWLESAVLRRSGGRWLLALLHSTRIEKPAA